MCVRVSAYLCVFVRLYLCVRLCACLCVFVLVCECVCVCAFVCSLCISIYFTYFDAVLQLTSAKNDQVGAAWFSKCVSLDNSFSVYFDFQGILCAHIYSSI